MEVSNLVDLTAALLFETDYVHTIRQVSLTAAQQHNSLTAALLFETE